MARLGDIFEVKSEGKYRYFQFVEKDKNWLNSDVIAVFNGTYEKSQPVGSLREQGVEFFTHTYLRFGEPYFWIKIGKAEPVDFSSALFKGVNHSKDPRQPIEGMSNHWEIRKVNGESKYVGKYKNVPDDAELGLVFDTESVVKRIMTGTYGPKQYGVDR